MGIKDVVNLKVMRKRRCVVSGRRQATILQRRHSKKGVVDARMLDARRPRIARLAAADATEFSQVDQRVLNPMETQAPTDAIDGKALSDSIQGDLGTFSQIHAVARKP